MIVMALPRVLRRIRARRRLRERDLWKALANFGARPRNMTILVSGGFELTLQGARVVSRRTDLGGVEIPLHPMSVAARKP